MNFLGYPIDHLRHLRFGYIINLNRYDIEQIFWNLCSIDSFLKETELVPVKILNDCFPDQSIKRGVFVKAKADEQVVFTMQMDTSFGQTSLMEVGFKKVHEIQGDFLDECKGGVIIIFVHLLLSLGNILANV